MVRPVATASQTHRPAGDRPRVRRRRRAAGPPPRRAPAPPRLPRVRGRVRAETYPASAGALAQPPPSSNMWIDGAVIQKEHVWPLWGPCKGAGIRFGVYCPEPSQESIRSIDRKNIARNEKHFDAGFMKELPSAGLQDPRNPQNLQNVEWEKHLPISELLESIRTTDTQHEIRFPCP